MSYSTAYSIHSFDGFWSIQLRRIWNLLNLLSIAFISNVYPSLFTFDAVHVYIDYLYCEAHPIRLRDPAVGEKESNFPMCHSNKSWKLDLYCQHHKTLSIQFQNKSIDFNLMTDIWHVTLKIVMENWQIGSKFKVFNIIATNKVIASFYSNHFSCLIYRK